VKLVIAGSRSWTDYSSLKSVLDDFTKSHKVTEIVSGTAKGADTLGEKYAKENGIPIKRFPAKWNDMSEPCLKKTNKYGEYNALAGHKRNEQMAKYCDFAIVFTHGSRGSKDMIGQMEKLGRSDQCLIIQN
jgi:hypothetical protein